jgi:glyoxylase-like metal-dependent hydrolase (beta-lactamase superfamily II)
LTLSRRSLFTATAGAAAAATLPLNLRAEAVTSPRTISYRRMVGDIEVTVLLDGYFLLEQAWVTGLDSALIVDGLAAAALDPTAAVPLPITATLFRRGDDIMLMDAGAGGSLGPTAGNLPNILAAVGVSPEAVSRVLLSHLHPDHIGGMLTGDTPAFPNATVHVSEADRAFWTDAANAAAVPEAIRPWFDLAGRVISAYGDRMMPFTGDADFGGGLSAVAMPGHTPGHSGFRISSGDAQALF